MKIAIIDPGYEHSHAHHQTVNLSIHHVMAKKGIETVVLASRKLDQGARCASLAEGLTVIPFFETPCYVPNSDCLTHEQHQELTDLFTRELKTLFDTGVLDGGEHTIFHTGYSFHIAGLARATWFHKGLMSGRLLISMMFHPGACPPADKSEGMHFIDEREYIRHKLALKLLSEAGKRSGRHISLAVPCRSYQKIYQSLWPADSVQLHPAVCYQPLKEKVVSRSDKPRVLLYLGGVKDEKGIEFSARFGAVAAQEYPHAIFIFHFNDDFPDSERFGALVEDLRRAGEKYNNVEILTGNLDAEGYTSVLQTTQIICLLYDPAHYKFKTSGVFWDALRCRNIAWLVTKDTWPEKELLELRIDHSSTAYGDVQGSIDQLCALLLQASVGIPDISQQPHIDLDYWKTLNRSFGEWILESLCRDNVNKPTNFIPKSNPKNLPNRGRILVVRTQYGHFSSLSGPSGFIPYLRSLGYEVDERLVLLGREKLYGAPKEIQEEFNQLTQGYLQSYQGNSAAVETEIQCIAHKYDVVHFLDAEHCGLLSALKNLQSGKRQTPQLIATYHQPTSIMKQIVSNPLYLKGFDRIHLMSPCQETYFRDFVDLDKLCVVPHGLASDLLEHSLPAVRGDQNVQTEIPGLNSITKGRKIILTVGNWLRDFDSLLATAELMINREDIVFVVVSKGLSLETANLDNVLILNQGISDVQLHALYLQASLLFLPLHDGAANNSILEAMAHALPIVTTDLTSTRYYTDNLARFSIADPNSYAGAIENALTELSTYKIRQNKSDLLYQRAQDLVWEKVAGTMNKKLFTPLLRSKYEIKV